MLSHGAMTLLLSNMCNSRGLDGDAAILFILACVGEASFPGARSRDDACL